MKNEKTGKVRVLAVDIDGCITPGEGRPADPDVLGKLRETNERAKHDDTIPRVTLCTGRQQPYVELMAQMTGIYTPAIFENGAGIFLPGSYDFIFHPSITDEMIASLNTLKAVIHDELVSAGRAKLQPGKEVSLSVYPAGSCTVEDAMEQLGEIIEREKMDFVLDESIICVNVLFPGVDKGAGIRWLAEVMGLAAEEIGAVGDASGDAKSLSAAGFSACPANATDYVKGISDCISPFEFGDGVVDIIDKVINMNKRNRR